MTPREIYNSLSELLATGEYLVCGFPGQHTLISCGPFRLRGELVINEWVVFATPSILLAMAHTVMRGEWWWERNQSRGKFSFGIYAEEDTLDGLGDGQIHLVSKHWFEQHTSLIFVSNKSVCPNISLKLEGLETLSFLKRKGVQIYLSKP